jgi:hypothetical protein
MKLNDTSAYQTHKIKRSKGKQTHWNMREPKRGVDQFQKGPNDDGAEECHHHREQEESKCHKLKQK